MCELLLDISQSGIPDYKGTHSSDMTFNHRPYSFCNILVRVYIIVGHIFVMGNYKQLKKSSQPKQLQLKNEAAKPIQQTTINPYEDRLSD